jgi:hypothetical protein
MEAKSSGGAADSSPAGGRSHESGAGRSETVSAGPGSAHPIPRTPLYAPYSLRGERALVPGKTYLWCSCGLSKKQPFWCVCCVLLCCALTSFARPLHSLCQCSRHPPVMTTAAAPLLPGVSSVRACSDGSHKGGPFKPLRFVAGESGQSYFSLCGCKHTEVRRVSCYYYPLYMQSSNSHPKLPAGQPADCPIPCYRNPHFAMDRTSTCRCLLLSRHHG